MLPHEQSLWAHVSKMDTGKLKKHYVHRAHNLLILQATCLYVWLRRQNEMEQVKKKITFLTEVESQQNNKILQ